MNTIFYKVLFFLGLRKEVPDLKRKGSKGRLVDIIRRNIIENDYKEEKCSQPRKITRFLYKRFHKKELSPNINNTNLLENPPDIKININIERRNKIESIVSSALSWLYTVGIFGLLCVQPIYSIIYIIREDEQNTNFYISSIFFQLIPPIQYLLAVKYFSTNHFEKFYINNKKHHINCFPSLNNLSLFIIVITAFTIAFNYIILKKDISIIRQRDGEFPQFNNFNHTSRTFISIFLILSWLYGKMVVYLNIVCFSLIFCKHCKIITECVNKLQNENKGILTVNDILREIIQIRYDLEESIDQYKNIFSSLTLFGSIGLGFILERIRVGNFDLFPWNSFIVYIILQFIFIFIIFKVTNNKESLSKYIKEPQFVEKFIKRYTIRDISERFSESETQLIILNIEEENSSTIDWMILNSIINADWTEFRVMGINVSDGDLIKKGLVLVTIIVTFNSYIT